MKSGTKTRQVVLADENNQRLGLMEILEAHRGTGVMHRAISVILHNGEGKVLLQRRSREKLLWPLYWSNTICTHPKDKEEVRKCAVRRLEEELGVVVESSKLREVYRFCYQARYSNEWSENEIDTVIVGKYKGEVDPDPSEVAEYKWMDWDELKEDVYRDPDRYTPWFKLILENKKVEKLVSR